jgi:hypothetical protein
MHPEKGSETKIQIPLQKAVTEKKTTIELAGT